jgi:hypothetical protein
MVASLTSSKDNKSMGKLQGQL